MSEPETEAGRGLAGRDVRIWGLVMSDILEVERQAKALGEAELRAKLAAKVRAMHDYAHDQWDVGFNAGIEAAAALIEGSDPASPNHETDIDGNHWAGCPGCFVRAGREGSDPASRSWPGRAEMEAMTDAEVNDVLESRGLDVRVIEGSDPASPEPDKAFLEWENTMPHPIEGSDPASPEPRTALEDAHAALAAALLWLDGEYADKSREEFNRRAWAATARKGLDALGAARTAERALRLRRPENAARLPDRVTGVEGSDPASPEAPEEDEDEALMAGDPFVSGELDFDAGRSRG